MNLPPDETGPFESSPPLHCLSPASVSRFVVSHPTCIAQRDGIDSRHPAKILWGGVCMFGCWFVCLCLSVDLPVCQLFYMSICLHVSVCMHTYRHVDTYKHVDKYRHAHVCVYLCGCMCACVCVRAHIRMIKLPPRGQITLQILQTLRSACQRIEFVESLEYVQLVE